jgi:uncharacterized protein YlxW (UPF0749 family)
MFEKEVERKAIETCPSKLDMPTYVQGFVNGTGFGYNKGKAETALLSQHILDLQKDKGNLTDRVRELEQQIEKMKSDVISERDKARCLEDLITYLVLNNILAKWEIKENE